LHTVDRLILEEKLVVFGDGDEEENGGDVLEAMDPLLSLGTLATDVKHAICEIADDECSLGDTGGLDTRAQDVLVVGNIVWSRNAVDGIEVAARLVSARCDEKDSWKDLLLGRVVELVLA